MFVFLCVCLLLFCLFVCLFVCYLVFCFSLAYVSDQVRCLIILWKRKMMKESFLFRNSQFLMCAIFIAVIIFGSMSPPGCSGCVARQNLTDTQMMQRIRQRGYLFMKNKLIGSNGSQNNFPNGAHAGTTLCPWKWALDDNPDRLPRFLSKAVCPSCNHYCKAIHYTHTSLIQRCDRTTGLMYWSWMPKTMAIAYVYVPNRK